MAFDCLQRGLPLQSFDKEESKANVLMLINGEM
jgi:hypothetical protein